MQDMTGCKSRGRAEAQRARILTAAQKCFIENGFHAASMASIAATAGMSAGLIYRYFENKSAIVRAIVDFQLELLQNEIQLNRQIDLPEEMVENYGQSCPNDALGMNAALLLEITAEATRDPEIAAALDRYDTFLREALIEWLCREKSAGGHGVAEDKAPARALILQCLFEGLKTRETREPGLDRGLLGRALREYVPLLLKA